LAVLIRDFPFSAAHPGEVSFKVMRNGINSVTDLWEECINRGKQDRTIKEVPSKETALLLRGMLTGVSRFQILGPVEIPDLTSHIIDFCVRALRGITE